MEDMGQRNNWNKMKTTKYLNTGFIHKQAQLTKLLKYMYTPVEVIV